MISIRRFLEQRNRGLEQTLRAAYNSALVAMGRSALQAYRATGGELQEDLDDLAFQVEEEQEAVGVVRAEAKAASLLDRWGKRTAEHMKQTAEEVKSLLVAVAGTADAVGERDQAYTDKLQALNVRLESIAQLDDMVRMRGSIVESATELKNQIREMVESSDSLTTQFRLQIDQYADKLKQSEESAHLDSLTRLLNRRGIEAALEKRLADRRAFSLIVVDLNRLKKVNDEFGHLAGDDLLRQFAAQLRGTLRPTDLIGRWGGDEFLLMLEGQPVDIALMTERLRKATGGEYSIATGGTTTKVVVQAAFGLANRRPGETGAELIARADRAMYMHKQDTRSAPRESSRPLSIPKEAKEWMPDREVDAVHRSLR